MNTRIINYPSPAGDRGIYVIISDVESGEVWNGTATEDWQDANLATYDVATDYLGGGRYQFTVPAALPAGATYQAAFKVPTTIGTPALTDTKLSDEFEFRWNGSSASEPAPGAADWYYADQDDVIALIGEANLRIISNVGDDDSTIDTARVQAAGEWADALCNLRFKSLGFDVPLANTNADTDALVTEANARLTAWKLYEARMLAAMQGKTPTEIGKIAEENKRMADDFFRGVTYRTIPITADRTYSRASKAEAYVPDTVPGCCGTWCQL